MGRVSGRAAGLAAGRVSDRAAGLAAGRGRASSLPGTGLVGRSPLVAPAEGRHRPLLEAAGSFRCRERSFGDRLGWGCRPVALRDSFAADSHRSRTNRSRTLL